MDAQEAGAVSDGTWIIPGELLPVTEDLNWEKPITWEYVGYSGAAEREAEKNAIADWIENGPHELSLDEPTCRWLAVQIRLNKHRAAEK